MEGPRIAVCVLGWKSILGPAIGVVEIVAYVRCTIGGLVFWVWIYDSDKIFLGVLDGRRKTSGSQEDGV